MNLNRMAPKTTLPVYTAVLCALAAAALAVWFAPESGILMTPDSLAYLHAADTLTAGDGYVFYGYSSPMIQWALLMPTFYAFVGLFTADVPAAMVFLNPVCLFLTLLFANLTAKHIIRKPAFALAAQMVISFSWAIWHMYFYLWSEVFFILALSALTYCFVRWLQEDRRILLVGAGISAALMLLARFSGIELAGLIGLMILFHRGHPWKKRLVNALIYGLIGAPLCCINLLRNYLLSGTLTGRSKPGLYSLSTNIQNTVLCILKWFDPDASGTPLYILALVLLLPVFLSLILLLRSGRKPKPATPRSVPLFLLLHCVLYIITCVHANTVYALDGVTARILSPILFCGVILFFWLLSQGADGNRPALRGTLAVCALALAVFSAVSNTSYLARTAPPLNDYFDRIGQNGDVAADYLADLDADTVKIWTNQPEKLYYLTGLDCNYIPRRESIELYSWDTCVQRWQESGKELLICWYDITTNPVMFQEEELQKMLSMTLAADLGTCRIYKAVLP